MHEAHITIGNRITVPRAVREVMGMKDGDIIGFFPSGRGFALRIVGRKLAEGRMTKLPAAFTSR